MRALLLLIAVCAIIAGSYSLYLAVYAYEPPAAELMINNGVVELKEGDSWQRITGNTALDQGATVRTKDGGATIVFFGASLLRLASNTEVTLTALDAEAAKVIVTQASGKTWSRVVKATSQHGVEKALGVLGLEDYELFLPSAVATVRGTSFSADADIGEVTVVTGTVALKANNSDEEMLVSNATAVVEVSTPERRITVRPREADAFVDENIARDAEFVESVVDRIEADAERAVRESLEPVRHEDIREFVAEIRKEMDAREENVILDERKVREEPVQNDAAPITRPAPEPVRSIEREETIREDSAAPIQETRDEPVEEVRPRPGTEEAPARIEERPQEPVPVREPVAETKEEPKPTGNASTTSDSPVREPPSLSTGSAGSVDTAIVA